jgi:hypothetical protein
VFRFLTWLFEATRPTPSRLRSAFRFWPVVRPTCSADFSSGRGGFHQLTRRVLVTVPPLPPRWKATLKPDDYGAYCLRPKSKGSASRFLGCRGYIRVHSRCGPLTRSPPQRRLCRWTTVHLVSYSDAIQATGLLVFAPVGLAPTEHASLRWSYGLSPTGFAVEGFRCWLRHPSSSSRLCLAQPKSQPPEPHDSERRSPTSRRAL